MMIPIAVREVMQSPVQTIDPDESVRAAATRLLAADIGSLVVCEGEEPVGILTDGDVTQIVADGRSADETTVATAMATALHTTTPDMTIEAAAKTLRRYNVKRLPVVDDDELVGIVTNTDLANYLPHLIRMGREGDPDPDRERRRVHAETAYEDDDWETEFVGTEDGIEVGDSVRFTKTISAADVEAFAEASGDTNRLHLDAEFAAGTRFGERIAHGTLVGGTISAALARLPGLTIYISQNLSYLGPVTLEERIRATCEVVEDLGRNRYRLNTRVAGGDGETVVDGEAVVVVDPLPETA